jgi:hypothetical protein
MQPLTVVQLDFLPASYRQQNARRRDRRWRAVLFFGGVVLLAGAWIYRVVDRRAAQQNFDALSGPYQTAVANEKAWQDAQQELKLANLRASLITYLRHPWMTSQTLAAIVGPVPETVRLTEIKILHEALPKPEGHAAPPKRGPNDPIDKAELALPPAERDLARLREEYDNQRVIVQISGEALESDALHEFIGALGTSDVFVRVELTSIFRDAGGGKNALPMSLFQARAILRPCIGQPGGTGAPAKPQLAVSLGGTGRTP